MDRNIYKYSPNNGRLYGDMRVILSADQSRYVLYAIQIYIVLIYLTNKWFYSFYFENKK